MDQEPKDATKEDDYLVWECSLCHNHQRRKHRTNKLRKSLFDDQNRFKDHYDRMCHICSSEFTSKISKDQHQKTHSNGISCTFKSLCSLCGKKFKVISNIMINSNKVNKSIK